MADGIVADHSAGRIAGNGLCRPPQVKSEIWDTHLFDGWQVEGSGPNKKVGVPIWKSKNHPARDGFVLDGLKGRDLLTTVPGVAAGCATPPWQ